MRFGLKDTYGSFVYGIDDACDLVRVAIKRACYAESREDRAEQMLLKQNEIIGQLIERVCEGDHNKMLEIVGLIGMDVVKHPHD